MIYFCLNSAEFITVISINFDLIYHIGACNKVFETRSINWRKTSNRLGSLCYWAAVPTLQNGAKTHMIVRTRLMQVEIFRGKTWLYKLLIQGQEILMIEKKCLENLFFPDSHK